MTEPKIFATAILILCPRLSTRRMKTSALCVTMRMSRLITVGVRSIDAVTPWGPLRLLRSRTKTNTSEQQGNQLALATNTGFHKKVPHVHAPGRASDAEFHAAIFQTVAFHQNHGQTSLRLGKAVEVPKFLLD